MMPEDLKARAADAYVSEIWKGRSISSRAGCAAIEGQRNVIKEKIAQLEHQIIGGEAQVKAYRAQLESVRKEIESIRAAGRSGPDRPPAFPAA